MINIENHISEGIPERHSTSSLPKGCEDRFYCDRCEKVLLAAEIVYFPVPDGPDDYAEECLCEECSDHLEERMSEVDDE